MYRIALVLLCLGILCGCGPSDEQIHDKVRAAHELRTIDLALSPAIFDAVKAGNSVNGVESVEATSIQGLEKMKVVRSAGYTYLSIESLAIVAERTKSGGVRIRYKVKVELPSDGSVRELNMTRTYPSSSDPAEEEIVWN